MNLDTLPTLVKNASLVPPAVTISLILSVASLMTLTTVSAKVFILATKVLVVPVTVPATSVALLLMTAFNKVLSAKSITPSASDLIDETNDFNNAEPALAVVTLSPPAPFKTSPAVTKKLAIFAELAINAVACAFSAVVALVNAAIGSYLAKSTLFTKPNACATLACACAGVKVVSASMKPC